MWIDHLAGQRLLRGLQAAFLAAALAACGGGGGDAPVEPPPPEPPLNPGDVAYADGTSYSVLPGASLASANEGSAVTHHEITARGTKLAYTARAGHLTSTDASGAKASFFYVAYTLDGQDAARRPVTFFYNGGPGSASVWLHLGSFGPRRLVTGDPSTNGAKPFPLVDNNDTLLDATDLVFVDAIGTGYSQAVAPRTNQSFWGVDVDAAAFRDFVQRYVAANARQASPKFLFGESYGGPRTAVLALLLETAGTGLSGVVLQSPALDYNGNCGVIGQGACTGYLPTYGAVGAYYRLLSPQPADLDTFENEMRGFALDSYGPALSNYLASGVQPAAELLAALAARTGVPSSRWQTRFNVDPGTFQETLVPGTLIGRYDARVSAPKGSPLASEGDPSSTFISEEFASAMRNYLRNELHYSAVTGYVTFSNAIDTWDFRHDGRPLPDTVPDLAAALALNPALQVLSVNGYHDLATPFFQTEQDLGRLGAGAPVQVKSYAGGHMTYLDDGSRPLELNDLKAFFYRATVPSAGLR